MSNAGFIFILKNDILSLRKWQSHVARHANDSFGKAQVRLYERAIAISKEIMTCEDIATAYAQAK